MEVDLTKSGPGVELEKALAQYLADKGYGVWRPAGPKYEEAERGIYLGKDPKLASEYVLLRSFKPIPEGRANLTFPIQVFAQLNSRNGLDSRIVVRNWADALQAELDQKSDIPPGHKISWVSEFSRLTFEPGTLGGSQVAQTFHFRGRRPVG